MELHPVNDGEPMPGPGETWTDQHGNLWHCLTVFPVKNRQGRFMRPGAEMEMRTA